MYKSTNHVVSVRHALKVPYSNWRIPQMKYFYFRFYIYSCEAYLLWSDKLVTTSRQKCQRIFLEKPQLCKGCRFTGVAPRKRSVIWREYQIQRDRFMLSVHQTRSTTEIFFCLSWSSHIGTSSKRTYEKTIQIWVKDSVYKLSKFVTEEKILGM